MMVVFTDEESKIEKVLKESKNIAVIGITKDPKKPGNYVPQVLKEKGFRLFGVNPEYAGEEIMGIKVFRSINEIPEDIDVVLVFRPPQDLPKIVNEAYAKGFKTFWMQPGTTDEEVKSELAKRGYNVVAERCIKIESERYIK
jgi:predicted CoA-binding protein